MSNNEEFMKLYDQTRENHVKLHNFIINDLTVWFVEGLGQRQKGEIADCRDFGAITVRGSVIITHDHGVWMKVNSQYWYNPITGQDSLMHDLDILRLLLTESEGGHIATIIDPGAAVDE